MYEPQYELKSFETMPGSGRVHVFSRLMAALVEANLRDMETVKRPSSSRMVAVSSGDTWQDTACVAMTGHGTVPSIVAYRIAELWRSGEKTAAWVIRGATLLVKRASGAYEDPCRGVSWDAGRDAFTGRAMWTQTLQLKSFESTPATLKIRVICKMLDVLHEANEQWLAAGHRAPQLYASGIRYQEEQLGHDQWQDMPRTIQLGFGDCEDLASWRVSELRHVGERAEHTVEHRKSPSLVLYHIRVRRQNGAIEDPSCRLGMAGTCQVLVAPDQVGHQTAGASVSGPCDTAQSSPEGVIVAAMSGRS